MRYVYSFEAYVSKDEKKQDMFAREAPAKGLNKAQVRSRPRYRAGPGTEQARVGSRSRYLQHRRHRYGVYPGTLLTEVWSRPRSGAAPGTQQTMRYGEGQGTYVADHGMEKKNVCSRPWYGV